MNAQASVQQSGPALLIHQVGNHCAPYLAACRESITRDLAQAPSAKYLASYFERGKMIRPILVFLSAAAVGGEAIDALPAAEAMEMLHVAALLHDDIIDRADARRGLPALHRCIGEAATIVVGDYLILKAFEVLARAAKNAPSSAVLKAVRLLSQYAQQCCRGQLREFERSHNGSAELQYFSIARGKTASQFSAAVTLGAAFGKASDQDFRALQSFGTNAGIAFQIRDDELDLTGDSAILGKPAGNSMEAGRPLLPLIYLAKHGSPGAKAAFANMQRDNGYRHDLIRLLQEEGVLERVRRIEQRFLVRACSALQRLRPSAERDALLAVGTYSVYRDY